MRVCILVFSPSGHTHSISKELRDRLVRQGAEVQLLNLTCKIRDMETAGISAYLEESVLPHDVLFMGSPVYAGHFESHGLKIIRNLPEVNRKWGRIAVPFVSYGGIHSSIALSEAGRGLNRRGRINAFGFKICSFHTLTKTLPAPLNTGKPDADDLSILDKAVTRIFSMDLFSIKDVRKNFAYTGKKERFVFSLLSQNFFHKAHRSNVIDSNKCTNCGLCINKCPVNAISYNTNRDIVVDQMRCILCAECFHNCSASAITFPYLDKVKERASGEIPLEIPASQIYPVTAG